MYTIQDYHSERNRRTGLGDELKVSLSKLVNEIKYLDFKFSMIELNKIYGLYT